jgi:hypothetical protein
VNLVSALVWGFGATIVLTTILRSSQALGQTRIDLPFILGSMITANRDQAKVLGYVIHVLNGWAFSLIYAAAFESAARADLALGLAIGLVHGAFVVVVGMPLLPAFHPRMASDAWGPEPTRQLEPPGNFGLNYGWSTPVVTLLAHLVFGAILGTFYMLSSG